MQKKYLIPVIGIGIILLLSVVYLVSPKSPKSERPSALQGPAPLAKGKQTYEIRTDKPSDYQITQVEVDPLDVKQGETQTVTVTVKDAKNNPITKENKVQGTVFTDLKTTNFTALLAQAGGPDLTMIWKGSWELQDTTDHRYMLTINAESAEASSKVDLSFR